ncbi:radical S-adenosyl methionine domain-containing protein 1, mitochondrial isoform 2-T2 [Alca torda]
MGLGLSPPSRNRVPGHGDAAVPHDALCPQWPYCRKRCSYCNFNKYVVPAVNEEAMRACLVREARTLLRLSQVQRWVLRGRGSRGPFGAHLHPPHYLPHSVTSVFFGGGTPSLASPRTMAAVLEAIAGAAHLPAGAEVTLEANPSSASPPRLDGFRVAGINRLSIGVQSLDDTELQLLGREHTAAEARGAVEAARRLFPGRTSIDLIFGLPGQSQGAWARGLEAALELCDDHVSLYQLTLERGTALAAQVWGGNLPAPPQDLLADMYQTACTMLVAAGFRRYEVSNFARKVGCHPSPMQRHPPSRLSPPSPHTLFSPRVPSAPTTSPTGGLSSTSVWGQVSWGDGGCVRGHVCPLHPIIVPPAIVGAHGRFVPWGEGGCSREARVQTLELDAWMREVQSRGHSTRRRVVLSPLEQLEEVLALGLRTDEGVTHERWGHFSPHLSLEAVFGAPGEAAELQQQGWLVLDGGGLRCRREGLALLDSLLPGLLCQLQRGWAQAHPGTPRRGPTRDGGEAAPGLAGAVSGGSGE